MNDQIGTLERAVDETAESEVVGKVRGWLKEQGYPLEMRAARAFQRADFHVQQSTYYRSPEGKAREIDVHATLTQRWKYLGQKSDGLIYLQTHVVCECKSGGKRNRPWVVFSTDCRGNRLVTGEAYFGTPLGIETLAMALEETDPSLDVFVTPGRVGYSIACALLEGPQSDDAAYNAVAGVTSAAHAIATEPPPSLVWLCRLVLPVLVVSTPLIECWLDENGENQLAERDMLTLVWGDAVRTESTGAVIHVVHERALDAYVAKVRSAFEHLREVSHDYLERSIGAMSQNPPYREPA